jgi:hypothetical protein
MTSSFIHISTLMPTGDSGQYEKVY